MRIGEAVALRWDDIDFESGILTVIDETGLRRIENRERRRTKGDRSRSIPFHDDLRGVLTSLSRTDEYVFHGPLGGRLKADVVRRALIRELIRPLESRFPSKENKQSFKDGRLHSFRHFFCRFQLSLGTPLPLVMEMLGHQDSEMARHYFHVFENDARKVIEQMNFWKRPAGRSGRQI
jgi:integrase